LPKKLPRGFAQIFFGGKLSFVFSRPCPTPPNAGDTKELSLFLLLEIKIFGIIILKV